MMGLLRHKEVLSISREMMSRQREREKGIEKTGERGEGEGTEMMSHQGHMHLRVLPLVFTAFPKLLLRRQRLGEPIQDVPQHPWNVKRRKWV